MRVGCLEMMLSFSVLCAIFSVSTAQVTRIHATATGYESMLNTYLANTTTTEPTPEPSSGEDGSGDTGVIESGMSTGLIAAIVAASLVALGAIVAGVLVYFFFSSPATTVNPAALGGTGVAFGKPVPRLIISAEALSAA